MAFLETAVDQHFAKFLIKCARMFFGENRNILSQRVLLTLLQAHFYSSLFLWAISVMGVPFIKGSLYSWILFTFPKNQVRNS